MHRWGKISASVKPLSQASCAKMTRANRKLRPCLAIQLQESQADSSLIWTTGPDHQELPLRFKLLKTHLGHRRIDDKTERSVNGIWWSRNALISVNWRFDSQPKPALPDPILPPKTDAGCPAPPRCRRAIVRSVADPCSCGITASGNQIHTNPTPPQPHKGSAAGLDSAATMAKKGENALLMVRRSSQDAGAGILSHGL